MFGIVPGDEGRTRSGDGGGIRPSLTSAVFSLLGGVLLLLIALPLLKIIFSVDGRILLQTAREQEVIDSIWLTLRASLYATFLCLLLGVPLAYLLARRRFRGKRLVQALIDLPVVVPHTAAGIALLSVFGRRFWLGRFFHGLGIDFVGSTAGISLAMFFVSLPFLVNAAREGFCAVDARLEKVARTLGAGPWKVFCQISLPLARSHIVCGAIMMWARGISEFGAVVILAYHPMTAPVMIFERFNAYGLRYSQPVAVILLLVCLFIFVLLRVLGAGRAR